MTTDEDGPEANPGAGSAAEGGYLAVRSAAEFETALQQLVTEAASNDVDVRGGWAVDGENGHPAWDVEITGIANRTILDECDLSDVTATIVETVAARERADVASLPPLYDSIDPEILESVFRPGEDDSGRSVTFRYCGYDVTVRADGSIVVDE